MRDLGTEVVALAEDVTDDLDDLFGVIVVLREDQGLGNVHVVPQQRAGVRIAFGPFREDLREQPVPEGLDHRSQLVLADDADADLLRAVLDVLSDVLVPLTTGPAIADWDRALRDDPALDGYPRFDLVYGKVDVDSVGDGFPVGVLADQVAVEVAEGLGDRGGGETDDRGVEVLQDRAPLAVDGTMALVDDDQVEGFGGMVAL